MIDFETLICTVVPTIGRLTRLDNYSYPAMLFATDSTNVYFLCLCNNIGYHVFKVSKSELTLEIKFYNDIRLESLAHNLPVPYPSNNPYIGELDDFETYLRDTTNTRTTDSAVDLSAQQLGEYVTGVLRGNEGLIEEGVEERINAERTLGQIISTHTANSSQNDFDNLPHPSPYTYTTPHLATSRRNSGNGGNPVINQRNVKFETKKEEIINFLNVDVIDIKASNSEFTTQGRKTMLNKNFPVDCIQTYDSDAFGSQKAGDYYCYVYKSPDKRVKFAMEDLSVHYNRNLKKIIQGYKFQSYRGIEVNSSVVISITTKLNKKGDKLVCKGTSSYDTSFIQVQNPKGLREFINKKNLKLSCPNELNVETLHII